MVRYQRVGIPPGVPSLVDEVVEQNARNHTGRVQEDVSMFRTSCEGGTSESVVLIFPLGKIRTFALQYLLTLLWGTYVKT